MFAQHNAWKNKRQCSFCIKTSLLIYSGIIWMVFIWWEYWSIHPSQDSHEKFCRKKRSKFFSSHLAISQNMLWRTLHNGPFWRKWLTTFIRLLFPKKSFIIEAFIKYFEAMQSDKINFATAFFYNVDLGEIGYRW